MYFFLLYFYELDEIYNMSFVSFQLLHNLLDFYQSNEPHINIKIIKRHAVSLITD